jgi:hypothetical protein
MTSLEYFEGEFLLSSSTTVLSYCECVCFELSCTKMLLAKRRDGLRMYSMGYMPDHKLLV